MKDLGENLLARPRFSGQHYGRIGGSHESDLLEGLVQ